MDTDREQLFGVLAFQAYLLDDAQFQEACVQVRREPGRPLADWLLARGWISADDRQHVEYLLDRKLEKHQGDPRAGLAAVSAHAVRQSLATLPARRDDLTNANLTPPPPPPPPPPRRDGAPKPNSAQRAATPPASTDTNIVKERYARSRLHAQGGIGQIWLARDHLLDRDVALKELRPETADDKRLWDRFLDEARITGQLEHPGIIPVYELRERADERPPFYIMRFVKGETLSDAIHHYHRDRRAGRPTPLAFLRLVNAFLTVCNTVAYAHARGVIHRDLKGANILLGDFGEVITLDWGLAKYVSKPSLHEDAAKVSMERFFGRTMTLQGQVLGTPAYMAPEQAEGRLDRIDERTDVFGLGAILYEILSDRPPFDGADTDEILRKVCDADPPKPRSINPSAPKSLEAVCVKAMARRPEDRYPSAGELAQDVQRWLADEPVRAYREPLTLRLRRWIGRHRTGVTAAAAAMLVTLASLVIGVVLLTRANNEIKKQRDEAEANLELALDAIDQSYTQISEDILLKEPGFQPLRQKLLGRSLEFYRALEERYQGNPRVRSVRGRSIYHQAMLTNDLQSPLAALPLIQDAGRIFADLCDAEPENPNHLQRLADCRLREGYLHYLLLDYAAADACYQAALERYPKVIEAKPDQPAIREQLGSTYANLGLLELAWKRDGYATRAEEAFTESLRIAEQLTKDYPDDSRFQANLAGVYLNRGNLFNTLYQAQPEPKPVKESLRLLQAADADCTHALEIWRKLHNDEPKDLVIRTRLGSVYNNLGNLYLSWSRFLSPDGRQRAQHQADDMFQACLRLRSALAKENPASNGFLFDLALTENNYANLLLTLNKFDDARSHYVASSTAFVELVSRDPRSRLYPIWLANVYNGLGNLASNRYLHKDSLDWYRKSASVLVAAFGETPANAEVRDKLRMAYWGVAYALNHLREYLEALPIWDKAHALDDGGHWQLELRCGRARALAAVGKTAEAMADAEEVAKHPGMRGENWYDLAAAAALSSVAAAQDETLPAAERTRLADARAALCIQWLEKAKNSPYLGVAGSREYFVKDKDFDGIRSRKELEEFTKGLME